MKARFGRFWYSSHCCEMRACSCAISRACWLSWLASMAGRAGVCGTARRSSSTAPSGCSRVNSDLACCSSSVTCACIAASSPPAWVCALAGSGLFSRRSSSVLPPPARFTWASASGLSGASALLALTSTTSIGSLVSSNRRGLTCMNCVDNSIACTAADASSASAMRVSRVDGSARVGADTADTMQAESGCRADSTEGRRRCQAAVPRFPDIRRGSGCRAGRCRRSPAAPSPPAPPP